MAIDLTATAKILSSKRNLEPNLILEIDGISTVFSTIVTLKAAKYGEDGLTFGLEGLVYGGSVEISDSKNYVTLAGSGPNIRQQLLQDKGGVQSVSSLNLELIDNNAEISKIVSPGVTLPEILGVRARVYLNFKNGRHPDDSVLIHRGIIDQVDAGPASIKLNIAHPEAQKRQDLFIRRTTGLDGAIDDSQTTITVDSVDGFLLENDPTILTYLRIEDEIIRYTGVSGSDFTGCVRGSLGTVPASHDDNQDVESFYRLQGTSMNMALQLMLSGGDEFYATELPIVDIGALGPGDIRPTYIRFNNYDFEEQYGLTRGDSIRITGSAFNDGTYTLNTFGRLDSGESFVTVTTDLVPELGTVGTADLKSQYWGLNEGMGMTPFDVDVPEHQLINTRFSSQIPTYDFYIRDTIKGKDFLSNEVYFAAGMYSLPRKSKASVGITVPPISDQVVPTLDEDTVVSPASLNTVRSASNDFYNAVVANYNEDALQNDKFRDAKVFISEDSANRIKNFGTKPITITSKGLKDTAGTSTLLDNLSKRLLDRYQFAAESLKGINVLYKTGFNVDVGDIVVFGSPALKVLDLDNGTRRTAPKLYEVVNKSLNVKTGDVRFDILQTAYDIDGRYGVISPSTKVASGSTTTSIKIKDSFSTQAPALEREKWAQYIGESILVHSEDWSYQEETVLTGFDPSDDYRMLVDPALSGAPLEDYVIDIPTYPDTTDSSVNDIYKLIHCSRCPQVDIVSGTSDTVFDVAPADIGKFFVGSILSVHNFSYSDYADDVVVTDITVNTITVDASLGFTPDSTHTIDLIGFIDLGLPYRYI